jgi:excisionase family DNA binding protein
MSTKYVTTRELAQYFGVAPTTVVGMVRSGEIPPGSYLRAGRVFRFDLAKVEQHLLQQSPSPGEGQLEFDFNEDS